jgi:DNA-binding GntR family transcriptional regulator
MNKNTSFVPKMMIDPTKSIADHVYESLKNGIIRGEIEPSQRLLEVEVAKMFNVSRTPVREAFRRLEQDCAAERLAQGGIRVSQLDEQTIEDLFNLRTILEVHAIELACARINAEEIAYLKQIRAHAGELLKAGDKRQDFMYRSFIELGSRFHDTIYNATRSRVLIKVISNIRSMVVSVRSMSVRLDSVQQVWDEHSKLIEHLERREKVSAVRLIKHHVSKTAGQVLSFIRSTQRGNDHEVADAPQGSVHMRRQSMRTNRRHAR